ncbi:hypothetical protein LXL04_019862 [Taraxacum kok-saghyz]
MEGETATRRSGRVLAQIRAGRKVEPVNLALHEIEVQNAVVLESKRRPTTVCPPIEEDDDDFVDPPQRKKAGQQESRETVTTVCPQEDDDGDDDPPTHGWYYDCYQKRVSSERCAELVLVAASHGLKEAWMIQHRSTQSAFPFIGFESSAKSTPKSMEGDTVRRRSGRVCAQIRPGRQVEPVHVDLHEIEVEHAEKRKTTLSPPLQEDDDDFVDPPQRKKLVKITIRIH